MRKLIAALAVGGSVALGTGQVMARPASLTAGCAKYGYTIHVPHGWHIDSKKSCATDVSFASPGSVAFAQALVGDVADYTRAELRKNAVDSLKILGKVVGKISYGEPIIGGVRLEAAWANLKDSSGVPSFGYVLNSEYAGHDDTFIGNVQDMTNTNAAAYKRALLASFNTIRFTPAPS